MVGGTLRGRSTRTSWSRVASHDGTRERGNDTLAFHIEDSASASNQCDLQHSEVNWQFLSSISLRSVPEWPSCDELQFCLQKISVELFLVIMHPS